MSAGIEVVALLPIAVVAGGLVVGVAAVGAVGYAAYATGQVAYAAAQQLEREYQQSLIIFRARVAAEQAAGIASARAHQSAMATALSSAARTRIAATDDANIAFLTSNIDVLVRRLGDLPNSNPQLPQQLEQLRQAVQREPENWAAHWASYQLLSDIVAQLAAHRRTQLAVSHANDHTILLAEIATELEALSAEVNGPLLDDEAGAPLRAELRKRLGEVRHLSAAQPLTAEQGLKMLHARVRRALATHVAHRELLVQSARQAATKSEARASRLRELAAQAGARLQAVAQVTSAPELEQISDAKIIAATRAEGDVLRRRLAQLLAGDLPDDLMPLQKLVAQCDALFARTQAQLEEIAAQQYLQGQLADVLGELGYRVTPAQGSGSSGGAEENSALQMTLRGQTDVGVQVRMEAGGHLVSEMVAFSPAASETHAATQEKVCDLMDEVFDALRARGCEVREKKRRHFREGQHKLRVVKRRKNSEQTTSQAERIATPIARKLP